jgi:hypothetical protein
MTSTARTGQQTSIDDIPVIDDDTKQAIRDWWEKELLFNSAKARIEYAKLEKDRDDAKEKAIGMLAVPADGNSHRFSVSTDDGWGTVIKVSPGGDPTPIAATSRKRNPQFRLEGTKPADE